MNRAFGRNRKLGVWLPYAAVAVVALTLVSGLLTTTSGSRSSYAFNVYWPAPSSYVPGDTPPNVYLQINYTGPGMGNFTYIIYYNSTAGGRVVSQGTVLVSKLSPFTAFAIIPVTVQGGVSATGEIFSNSPTRGDLVYTKSINM